MRVLYSWLGIASAALIIGTGCVDDPAARPDSEEVGSIRLDLQGQAPSGKIYRLRNAVITVTGAGATTVWNTEASPDLTSLSANVVIGAYTASIADGWTLERVEASASVAVRASLTSANPAPFTVAAFTRTQIPLQFMVDGDAIDMSQGYDITISVTEPPPPRLFVTSPNLSTPTSSAVVVFPADGNGNIAPLQTITGPLTTLRTPRGIAVAGDQMIVADEGTAAIAGALSFFPIAANGNVAPTRRIALTKPDQVAESNGKVYVGDGTDVVVFATNPASGDAPIARITTGATVGPISVANGEVFVSLKSLGKVGVFAANGNTLTRTLTTPCPIGLGVLGDELYVADACSGKILVYPRTWTGDPLPLRALSTDSPMGSTVASKGELFVAVYMHDAVRVWAATGSGAVSVKRAIVGAATKLLTPSGVALH